MGPKSFSRTPVGVLLALCLAPSLLAGCKDEEKHRASVEFQVEGARVTMDRLRRQIAREPLDAYGMQRATDSFARALGGVPARVEDKAATRVQERKASAEKAVEVFTALRPVLESLEFDRAEANAKLNEVAKLLGEVERP
jgi:outer membrane murein-binding lipoprotein Lpp